MPRKSEVDIPGLGQIRQQSRSSLFPEVAWPTAFRVTFAAAWARLRSTPAARNCQATSQLLNAPGVVVSGPRLMWAFSEAVDLNRGLRQPASVPDNSWIW